MVGILGLIVAIVCVIALIWKNWTMAIVSLAGALIVIAFNAMGPVTTLSEKFMTGMSGFAGNWFLLFMLGAIFGKVMGDSGASVGIANKMLKILGEKSVVLVVMLTGLVLSYGGIGTFIIAFSLYPIAVAPVPESGYSEEADCCYHHGMPGNRMYGHASGFSVHSEPDPDPVLWDHCLCRCHPWPDLFCDHVCVCLSVPELADKKSESSG